MSVFSEEIAEALAMIDEFGLDATLVRSPEDVDTAGGEEPWRADFTDQAGAGGNDQPATYPIKAVVLPYKRGRGAEAFDESEALITRHRSLLIAASGLSVSPEPGDIVKITEEDWMVIGSTSLAPDGTPIIYRATIGRV